MRILITGGAGYIGSHTTLACLRAGHEIVVVDNLVNSKVEALHRVARLAGRAPAFARVDVNDREGLAAVFARHEPEAVIHFAGLKAVGESVSAPLAYYANNVVGTISLCRVMDGYGVRNLVFSSSATVYGEPLKTPITEEFPLGPTNPYGRTKHMIELVLKDLHAADPSWNMVVLRYFNPVGADPSGLIGEDPRGVPNNLLPYIAQVGVGRLPAVAVFGSDYPTPDGTGIRDYIHVTDLADGHLAALRRLDAAAGYEVFNLGTGRGHSVLEVISAFRRASGCEIPCRITGRRPGDIAVSYADVQRAAEVLGWRARKDMDGMCADAWRWQRANPNGYEAAGDSGPE